MKNRIFFLVFNVMLVPYALQGRLLDNKAENGTWQDIYTDDTEDADQADTSNNMTSQKSKDHYNRKKTVDDANKIKCTPGILGALFYSLYVKELQEDTYITFDESHVVSLNARSEKRNNRVEAKASHEIDKNSSLAVFNKQFLKEHYQVMLEDGTKAMWLPKGTEIQTQEIDPVKTTLIVGGIITAVGAFIGFKQGYLTFDSKRKN